MLIDCYYYASVFLCSFSLFLFLYSFFTLYAFLTMIMVVILLFLHRFPVTVLRELGSCFLPGAEGWRVSARLIAPSQSLQHMALPGWSSFSCDSQIDISYLSVRCAVSHASFSEPGCTALPLAVRRASSSELRPGAGRARIACRAGARSAERSSERRTLLAAGGWCGASRRPVLCHQLRGGVHARGPALLCRVCSQIGRGERERRRASRPPAAREGSGGEGPPALRPAGLARTDALLLASCRETPRATART